MKTVTFMMAVTYDDSEVDALGAIVMALGDTDGIIDWEKEVISVEEAY